MALMDILKKKAKKNFAIDENIRYQEEHTDEGMAEQVSAVADEKKGLFAGIAETQLRKLSALYDWYRDDSKQASPGELLHQLWPIHENDGEEQKDDEKCIQVFVNRLEDASAMYAELIREEPETNNESEDGNEGQVKKQERKPVNAAVQIYIFEDRMAAYVCLLPPVNGGAHVNQVQVMVAMKMARISFGLRQEEINRNVLERQYFRIFRVAAGVRPVDGIDGEVVDYFAREEKSYFQEDEKGNVDLKNIHSYQQIAEDAVICDIILPIPGTDGRDVNNHVIKCAGGRSAVVPKGRNTRLNKEGTKLIAATDGYLKFHGGNFEVEKKLFINGNIDYNTGNIDFPGDVEINGDVSTGFEVKATGSISVNGMVEAALLKAGQDIEIRKGMNGSRRGRLEARGAVRSRFLENCTVFAGEDVSADSIVNCEVNSNGSVSVLTGRGVIIGGSITVRKAVQAKRIGNQSNCENLITLGNDQMLAMEQAENEKNLAEAENMFDRVNKNVTYLQSLSSLPESKKEMLKQLLEQQAVWEEKRALLREEKHIMDGKKVDFMQCRVMADTIFPYTRIDLKFTNLIIKDVTDKCNIYYSAENHELRLGTS